MPTLVNNLRAIRGPVTAVPMVGASGVIVEPDTANNQVVVRADETVLWEGTISYTSDSGVLSEPISNFNEVKFLVKFNRVTPDAKQYLSFSTDISNFSLLGGLTNNASSTGSAYMGLMVLNIDANNTIRYINGKQWQWGPNTSVSDSMNGTLYKVIGINRKAQQG